jgi:hypothetical protein
MIDLSALKAAARTLAPVTPEKASLLAAASALVVAGAKRSRRAEQVVKPLVMTAIGVSLWRSRGRRDALDNALLGVAAAASFAGDQLMLEEEFAAEPADADRWIRRGAAAFAVNHVATISLAVRHGARPGPGELLPRVAGLAEGLVLLAARRREQLWALGGYSKLLAVMSTVMAAPQLTADAEETDPRRALELGGVLFLASDATILHRQVFLDKDGTAGALAEGWVLASYCAAQALIFGGLAKLTESAAG